VSPRRAESRRRRGGPGAASAARPRENRAALRSDCALSLTRQSEGRRTWRGSPSLQAARFSCLRPARPAESVAPGPTPPSARRVIRSGPSRPLIHREHVATRPWRMVRRRRMVAEDTGRETRAPLGTLTVIPEMTA
jgi:hypothetical protein